MRTILFVLLALGSIAGCEQPLDTMNLSGDSGGKADSPTDMQSRARTLFELGDDQDVFCHGDSEQVIGGVRIVNGRVLYDYLCTNMDVEDLGSYPFGALNPPLFKIVAFKNGTPIFYENKGEIHTPNDAFLCVSGNELAGFSTLEYWRYAITTRIPGTLSQDNLHTAFYLDYFYAEGFVFDTDCSVF